MRYKIIRSTSNQFNGIEFTADELTVQKIEEVIHISGTDILIYEKNQNNEYYCVTKHMILVIKEEV